MTDVLFEAKFASDAVNDIIRFTGAAPNGVVTSPCNWAGYPAGCIQLGAIPTFLSGTPLIVVDGWTGINVQGIFDQWPDKNIPNILRSSEALDYIPVQDLSGTG